jgi:hypothetical protein
MLTRTVSIAAYAGASMETGMGASDFDFLHGEWTVVHRRLKERLAGSNEWETFGGWCSCRATLGGAGNVDDNWIDLPGGGYRAVTIRSFDAKTTQWSIWWLDQRWPHFMGVPVLGGFADGVGELFADDTDGGRPVRVRFRWTQTPDGPRWEQAFAPQGDGPNLNWEINWIMDFRRKA